MLLQVNHSPFSPTKQNIFVVVVAKSCLILLDPTDCSPPGSSVHGVFQARILEWVAMPSSRGSFQPRDQTYISSAPALQADSLTPEPPGEAGV